MDQIHEYLGSHSPDWTRQFDTFHHHEAKWFGIYDSGKDSTYQYTTNFLSSTTSVTIICFEKEGRSQLEA